MNAADYDHQKAIIEQQIATWQALKFANRSDKYNAKVESIIEGYREQLRELNENFIADYKN